MKRLFAGAVIGALVIAGLGLWSGVVAFQFPWQVLPDFTEVEVEVSLPEEARIVAVEPIALDCRARIFAEVPVEGRREHTAFGRVYRTDTVTMTAHGDVDTCVEGVSTQVTYHRDGRTEVVIPGESILFVRPRVDAVESASTVEVNKGLVGKVTDVAPWVSDDLGLTPLAYAYAQSVIGSSECMEAAYDVTEQVLIDAYTEQFLANGADPSQLTVRIQGEPNFIDSPRPDMGEVDMSVDNDGISCSLSNELGGAAGDNR